VVGLWNGEVGEGACGAVGCEHAYYYLDGDAVGGVCEVEVWRGEEVELVGRGGWDVDNVCKRKKIIEPCTEER
jgi:hypothetical protein